MRTSRYMNMLSMSVFFFFQCGWRVRSDGAACMSAFIRALPPTDAPFGRDMECVRCVACATTREWSAFFFFFVRSVVPIGIVSKAGTTCCQVCMYRVRSWTPCFSCAVVSRSINLPPFVSQQECVHGACCQKKKGCCVGWHVGV